MVNTTIEIDCKTGPVLKAIISVLELNKELLNLIPENYQAEKEILAKRIEYLLKKMHRSLEGKPVRW